jgi:putative nucleotidyltransferase with HDIG domain
VLFLDDDRLVARAMARDIDGAGDLAVTVAVSVPEALELLGREVFGVVLTDYNMPGMNGIEFLDRVRAVSPDTVRILVSGKADLRTAVEVINRVGLFGFVLKPWDAEDLRGTVQRAMRHYELTVENRVLNRELGRKVVELADLNGSLEDEVQRRTTSLMLGLIAALDLRDTETQSHSRRVALYARRLARQLGVGEAQLLDVERGALLHDVGKIGVSDAILLKPGKLTEEEWVEMRKHPEHGYRLLSGIEFLQGASAIVLEHHESWNGAGYPGKLAGDDINLGARIFAVIDTYDAMTSDRPYRKALSHETAVDEILRMKGIQFDPRVVEAWMDIPRPDLEGIRIEVDRDLAVFR